jgi:hypothetical protein
MKFFILTSRMPTLQLPTKGLFQSYRDYKTKLFEFLNNNATSISSIFTPEVQFGSYQGYDQPESIDYTIRFEQEVIIPKKFNYDTKDSSQPMTQFIFDDDIFIDGTTNKSDSFKVFLQAIHELFPGLKQRYHNVTFNFPRQLNQRANSNINIRLSAQPSAPAAPPSAPAAPPSAPAAPPSAPPLNNINEDPVAVQENTKKCMCPCSCNSPNAKQIGGKRKTRSKKNKRRQTHRR